MRRIPAGIRCFLEIALLVTVALASDKALRALYTGSDFRADILLRIATRIPVFACSWLLLWFHDDNLGTIGLRKAASWLRAILIGIVAGITIFIAVWVSEQLGFHRDLSHFQPLHGNLELTVYHIVFVLVAAGFYEEFVFRGFIFQRFAVFFGDTGPAWVTACFAQATLFGLGHSYQNPLGILITGSIGLIMGVLFLGCGRNLWPVIIGHGLYDASRTVWFYLYGVPG
jgi:membrane protease YdiL (CAAX protease family)